MTPATDTEFTETQTSRFPVLRQAIQATTEAEAAWSACLDQCKNVDAATHKTLDSALTDAGYGDRPPGRSGCGIGGEAAAG